MTIVRGVGMWTVGVHKWTKRPPLDPGKVFVPSRIKKCYLEQTRLAECNALRLPIGFTTWTVQNKVVLQIFSKIFSSPDSGSWRNRHFWLSTCSPPVGISLLGLCTGVWRNTYPGVAFVNTIKISSGGIVAILVEFIVEKVDADIFVLHDELINDRRNPGKGGWNRWRDQPSTKEYTARINTGTEVVRAA